MLKAAPDFLSHNFYLERTYELKSKLRKETKIWVTIYNAKPAKTDDLFVNEIRLIKTFQAKTPLASDTFEPTASSRTA